MSRTGKTAEEALATLREGSERDHVDIGEAATQIVLQALARARARREATE